VSEAPFTKLYPARLWKPEMEDMIWWHLPIVRSPYIGCPKLENWPYDILTCISISCRRSGMIRATGSCSRARESTSLKSTENSDSP